MLAEHHETSPAVQLIHSIQYKALQKIDSVYQSDMILGTNYNSGCQISHRLDRTQNSKRGTTAKLPQQGTVKQNESQIAWFE